MNIASIKSICKYIKKNRPEIYLQETSLEAKTTIIIKNVAIGL